MMNEKIIKAKVNSYILIMSLLIIGLQSNVITAQEKPNMHNDSLYTTVKTVDNSNIVYLGMRNPITIEVKDAILSSIRVTTKNGALYRSNVDGEYLLSPKAGRTCLINIYAGDKQVAQHYFVVKMIPDPVARLRGVKNPRFLNKNRIVNANGIEVVLPKFPFDVSYKVVGFTVSNLAEGVSKEASQSSSWRFTSE